MPICAANSESTSKQLLSKCWLHKTLCSLGPSQFALVFWTFLIHFLAQCTVLGKLEQAYTVSICIGAISSNTVLYHDRSIVFLPQRASDCTSCQTHTCCHLGTSRYCSTQNGRMIKCNISMLNSLKDLKLYNFFKIFFLESTTLKVQFSVIIKKNIFHGSPPLKDSKFGKGGFNCKNGHKTSL